MPPYVVSHEIGHLHIGTANTAMLYDFPVPHELRIEHPGIDLHLRALIERSSGLYLY
jgi:hypothetical protein